MKPPWQLVDIPESVNILQGPLTRGPDQPLGSLAQRTSIPIHSEPGYPQYLRLILSVDGTGDNMQALGSPNPDLGT